jgi:Ca2+-binding RTX toxin-like protein
VPHRIRHALGGTAIAAIAALALPSLASATTTCAFASASHTLSVVHTGSIDDITIRRVPLPADPSQATIEVFEGATNLACGGSVTQVDTIAYNNSGGISDLILEEPDSFAPGFSPEGIGAVPEIETTVANTGGILSDVVLRDGDGLADRYVFGTGTVFGVNVNTDDPVPDVDVSLVAPFFQDFVAEGGPGADTFTGAGGEGTGGPYTRDLDLRGGLGNDTLVGTPGRDFFHNDPGDDLIDGGGGTDVADYYDSTLPIDIDLARPGPQVGGSLGRDTLTSIEEIDGSAFNDVLRGTAGNDGIFGFDGDDLIEGRGGDDELNGNDGADTVSYESAGPVAVDLALITPQATGGAGGDRFGSPFENLRGGPATDVLRGTAGPNVIEGGGGGDVVLALEGEDTVLLRDGIPDTADCGPDNDRATVDPGGIDVTIGCESVAAGVAAGVAALPGAPGTSGGPGAAGRPRVAATLKGPGSQRLVRGAVTLRLACPVLSCAARATASTRLPVGIGARKRAVALLPTRARIIAGESKLLRLRLAPAGLAQVRAALAAGRHPVVRVTVVVTDAAAARGTLRRTIVVLP